MDRRRLQYFLMVAEEGNVLRAANRIGIAQSALSRQIQALEADLRLVLFERLSTGMRLTNAGEVYRREAAKLLLAFENAQRLAKDAGTGGGGAITIGVNELSVRDERVLDIIETFRRGFPGIVPNFIFGHSQSLLEKIWRREADIGFVYGMLDTDAGISSHTLRSGIYELLMPASHPLAQLATVTTADIGDYPFIVLKQDPLHVHYWDRIFNELVNVGVIPNIACEASTSLDIVALVGAGAGIAFLHDSIREALTHRLVMRPVADLRVPFTLSVAWRRDNHSPALDRLIDVVSSFDAGTVINKL